MKFRLIITLVLGLVTSNVSFGQTVKEFSSVYKTKTEESRFYVVLSDNSFWWYEPRGRVWTESRGLEK